MTARRHAMWLLALALALPAWAQSPYEQQIRDFETFAAAEMKAQRMPGLSVAVMKEDFVWSAGFGLADIENNVPATAESSYRLASVTKPMTAVAVMKLVEDGKIDLDAEVQRYVPDFPRKPHPVTVRQLLGHLGGISHYRNYAVEGRIREPKNTKEALAIFQDFDLVAEPGTRYFYSSYGYNLLGAVIERASGKSYGDFMREAVWKPLGMTSTRMDNPREIIPNRVRGYELARDGVRNSEYVDISSRFAAGGTRSTVVDLIRFVQGIAAGKIVRPEMVDRMWTSLATREGRTTDYGLGWGVSPEAGRFAVSHGGSQQETRTLLLYLPRQRFAIALASNLEDASLWEFANRLALLFLGDSWNIGPYVPDRAEQAMLNALDLAYLHGLGYHDRFGRAMTADRTELTEAFRYLNRAFDRGQKDVDDLVRRGRHPAAGEPFTKAGSYIAARLAQSGSELERYHREGELAFFNDYIALYRRDRTIPQAYRFDAATERVIHRWNADWSRLWTDELKRLTVAGLAASPESIRPRLAGSSIIPDYSRGLVGTAENAGQRGNFAEAMRVSTLALELYPHSEQTNGLAGVLAIINGEMDRGRALLKKSQQIDPRGYSNPRNLLNIAGVIPKPAARALLTVAAELHPDSAEIQKKLAE